MNDIQQFKCPNCGGGIEFDPHTGKPTCPYCGTEFEIETLQSYDDVLNQTNETEVDFNAQQAGQLWDEGDNLHTYICQSCRGAIVTDNTTSAQKCPYCGNPVVITKNLEGNLKPDLVVPFEYDKDQAMAAFHKHLKDKPLLPKMFKETNLLEEIKGVYVPFWLYDTDINASARFKATKTRSWSDHDYQYTETSYFAAYRSCKLGFDNVPVDGSTKVDSTMMESLEPFDMNKAVDFHTAYLRGYFADKYDIDSEKSQKHAYQRMRKSVVNALESTLIEYDSADAEAIRFNVTDSNVKYCLLPVWLLTTNYKGEKYTFAMNGQNGKFVGDLPTDNGAFWTKFITNFAGISAVIYGAQWLFKLFVK